MFAALLSFATTTTTIPTTITTVHLKTKYEIWADGSFSQITPKSNWSYITGITLGLEWVENHKDFTVHSTKSFTSSCDGVLEYYLVVNGLIKVYTRNISITATYSI